MTSILSSVTPTPKRCWKTDKMQALRAHSCPNFQGPCMGPPCQPACPVASPTQHHTHHSHCCSTAVRRACVPATCCAPCRRPHCAAAATMWHSTAHHDAAHHDAAHHGGDMGWWWVWLRQCGPITSPHDVVESADTGSELAPPLAPAYGCSGRTSTCFEPTHHTSS